MSMFRRLLLSAAIVAFVGAASAQTIGSKASLRTAKKGGRADNTSLILKNVKKADPSTGWIQLKGVAPKKARSLSSVTAADAADQEYYWWGNYAEGLNILSLGSTSYHLAAEIPAVYAGCQIDSVGIMFFDKEPLSNVKVWFDAAEESVPSTASEADYSFDVVKDSIIGYTTEERDGETWTMVSETGIELPQTYTVPEGGCVIGYSFNTTADDYPVVVYTGADVNGGFYIYGDLGSGEGWYNGYGSGNLTICARLNVTNLPKTNATPTAIIEGTALLNGEAEVGVLVENNSLDSINSLSYIMTVNGVAGEETTYVLEDYSIAPTSYDYIYPTYTATEAGLNEVTFTITKVNGEANVATENSVSGNMIVMEKSLPRISVVEDFSATWYGYCPNGHVGLKKLKEQYGDSIITLSGHYSYNTNVDPMHCEDYFDVVSYYLSDFSSAAFDRLALCDTYTGLNSGISFGSNYVVDAIKALYPSEATVALTAAWADEAKTSVNVDVKSVFGYDRFLGGAAPYGLAFILTENGMTGTDDTWLQANYYSQSDPAAAAELAGAYPDFADWLNAGEYVSMAYDNVVVGAWNALNGYSVFDEGFMKDEEIVSQATLDLSSNSLIQNKNNLYLTVLLINQNGGYIANAAQVYLGDPAGIENATSDVNNAKEVARYNVSGVRLAAPQKGLNIVKLSDGRSMKMMVK